MVAMRITLIRQRPSIGDCLLLGPLIREVKRVYPGSQLTVITDPTYLAGALPLTFAGIEGIDRIEHIPMLEWTTDGNKTLDPIYNAAGSDLPLSVLRADLILDCNSAFIFYEREHTDKPLPYGIAEFWLRHHALYHQDVDLLPRFTVSADKQAEVDSWLSDQKATNPVGIVLRAGDSARDWDYEGKSFTLLEWLYTAGFTPVTIDPIKRLESSYGVPCIGRQIDFVAGVLVRCKAVITPDTGLLHLAQAVGTKTVALWGILEPRLRVDGYNTTVVPSTSLGFCAAQDRHCQCRWKAQQWSCLRRLPIHQIIDATKKALSQ